MAAQKSTTVRIREVALGAFLRYADRWAPERAGRLAHQLWFTPPTRMPAHPLPEGGTPFTVHWDGIAVLGTTWGDGPVVYLVHGWGGRGSQLAAFVGPLVERGFRVVAFDAPSHGDTGSGATGRQTNGMEFARALAAVAARFGPADAVVAHSLGAIVSYLARRFGSLETARLVLVAPMVEAASLFDEFQRALGFGPRTRAVFDREVDRFVGLGVAEFDARVQAAHVPPVPTLVVTDEADRQTPYTQAAGLARSLGAELVTTTGLGHRRILRDPDVVERVAGFVAGDAHAPRVARSA